MMLMMLRVFGLSRLDHEALRECAIGLYLSLKHEVPLERLDEHRSVLWNRR